MSRYLWVVKLLLIFRIGDTKGNENQNDAILQYLDDTRPMDSVDETYEYVWLRYTTDVARDHSPR